MKNAKVDISGLTARQRLQRVLSEIGPEAKKSLGQHFLVNDLVISRMLEKTKSLDFQHIIEIGPGPGALTELLLQLDKSYLAIELDHRICNYWRNLGIEVIEEDALKVNWSPLYRGPKNLLISNLPYQISASIVIDRSLDKEGPDHMILMFQKEVAQRVRGEPRGEHYGILSVIAQSFWEIEMVSEAGPGDFDPPPKVASRVLYFKKRATPLAAEDFLFLVKQSFQQRRKLLRKNLGVYLQKVKKTEADLESWLTAQGLSPMARAEELSVAQFQKLFQELR